MISVEIGYELQSIVLTEKQWKDVQQGKEFRKSVWGSYEGQSFRYYFSFNDPSRDGWTLVVSYGDAADGYIGNIEDAMIQEIED